MLQGQGLIPAKKTCAIGEKKDWSTEVTSRRKLGSVSTASGEGNAMGEKSPL